MKNTKRILIAILFLSVAARVGASILLGDKAEVLPGTYDQISYHTLATRLLGGYGFSFGQMWWPITAANAPTAHWSFLYTLYLAGVYLVFGIHPLAARLIQALLTGLLQPYLVFLIGRKIFNDWVGLIAAGLMAFYIYFIYYASTLMTEPFFITAILLGIYLSILIVERTTRVKFTLAPWISKPAEVASTYRGFLQSTSFLSISLGLALGATILLRQLYMLFVPFLLLWILWSLRHYRKEQIRVACLSLAVVAAMILPFTAYNFSRFGRFVLLNTNAGYAFFWANHPIYGTQFEEILTSTTYAELIPQELTYLDEAALDQALLRQGLQFVIQDPARYLLLSLSRIPVYFKFWPSPDDGMISNISRVFSFGLLWPFMLYGLFRSGKILLSASRRWKDLVSSPLFLLYTFIVVYTAIHLLSWALIRYRLPVDAVSLIFSGLAFYDLVPRLLPRRIQIPTTIRERSV